MNKIIARGDNLIVFQSSECTCINVTFRQFNLHLTHEDFEHFAYTLYAKFEKHSEPTYPKHVFHIDTPSPNIHLHFNYDEMKEIVEVLKHAQKRLMVQNIALNPSINMN